MLLNLASLGSPLCHHLSPGGVPIVMRPLQCLRSVAPSQDLFSEPQAGNFLLLLFLVCWHVVWETWPLGIGATQCQV